MPSAHEMVAAHYDPLLVTLSVVIAIFASYTALDLAGRVHASRGRGRLAWLAGGSLAMGVGIWSMHFVGMLACKLPVPVAYDVPLWLLSVVVAIVASALALYVVGKERVGGLAFGVGGALLAAAISGMHYVGMFAMRIPGRIGYDPRLVGASIVVALVASYAALFLALRFRADESRRGRWGKVGSGVVMGLAISGMHYTAMAACTFYVTDESLGIREGDLVATSGLAVSVVVGTIFVLGISLVSTTLDRRLRRRAETMAFRRRMEEELRRSEARLREAQEVAELGSWELDIRSGRSVMSDEMCRIYGLAPGSSLSPHEFYAMVHPADRDRVREWTDRVMVGAEAEIEYRIVRSDESVRVMSSRQRAEVDPNGRPVRIFGVEQDVTERRRLEEELRDRERRLREAQSLARLGSWEWTVATGALVWSDELYRIHGVDSREFEPSYERFLSLVHPEDRSRIDEAVQDALETREGYSMDLRIVRPDGEVRTCAVEGRVVTDAEGRPVRLVGTNQDVTEQRRLEDDLRQARDRAEEASRVKSEFVAKMSHEIRTPMNGVIGMTELVLGTELTAEQREYLEAVRSSGFTLLGVIGDILDFSKIEAKKLELAPAPFELSELLRTTLRGFEIQAVAKGLALDLVIDGDVPRWLEGDAGRLRQVVVNLVGNATKFTETGSVRLEVRPEGDGDETMTLGFSVVDTGIGIPPDRQESVFEAFAQGDTSLTRQFGGTGLGLSISAELVRMMGGRLMVESIAGEGSTFYFTARFGHVAESEPSEAIPAVDVPDVPTRVLRVLVAEDHPINQKLVARLLEHQGHRPTLAKDGAEALALVNREDFDLVLMDLQMPRVDGLTATRAIRRREAAEGMPRLPIVALTAHAVSGDRERCLKAGMDGYLAKPVLKEDLVAMLARISGIEEPAVEEHEEASETVEADAAASSERRSTDLERFSESIDGDVEFLGEILEELRNDDGVSTMRRALAASDSWRLAKEAHRMKGMLSVLHASSALKLAAELEVLVSRNELERAPRTLDRLEREIDRVQTALEGLAHELCDGSIENAGQLE